MMNEDQNGSTALVARAEQVLQGQVAQLLNEREIVINIGSERGVQPGMKFAILADQPTKIYDPSSGQLLDTVDREKTRVEATEVRPKITICRTYRTRWHGGDPLYDGFGLDAFDLTQEDTPREVVETLRTADSSYLPPLSYHESYVKIKDRVVQVS